MVVDREPLSCPCTMLQLHSTAPWAIFESEALKLLRRLPDDSIDDVVTDPPYRSGGPFRGDRIKNTG